MKKHLAILGSTGSIGTQALEVVRQHPDRFCVEVLTAGNRCDQLIRQAMEFKPNAVVIGNTSFYAKLKDALKDEPVKVFAGEEAISQVVEMEPVDMVLCAMVGYSGLRPAIRAIRSGKHLALANKEVLVAAGQLVMQEARHNRVMILPVDSEHSAVFQCLTGEPSGSVEKIILTASGGPFRGMKRTQLLNVTRNEALSHPNWKMGDKITIDSATLMNKGLEVIEAKWLFDLQPSQIEVVIHPQSIIHSMVQFRDGSLKAQMGLPDMRMPILFALGYPERISSNLPRFRFQDHPSLTFESPNRELSGNLDLAYLALEKGGNIPCVLNAANEVAVKAFLEERIGFLQIGTLIEEVVGQATFIGNPSLDDLLATHLETLRIAGEKARLNTVS